MLVFFCFLLHKCNKYQGEVTGRVPWEPLAPPPREIIVTFLVLLSSLP